MIIVSQPSGLIERNTPYYFIILKKFSRMQYYYSRACLAAIFFARGALQMKSTRRSPKVLCLSGI
jgi:hypothetical protein